MLESLWTMSFQCSLSQGKITLSYAMHELSISFSFSNFYRTLKERVSTYFKENKIVCQSF